MKLFRSLHRKERVAPGANPIPADERPPLRVQPDDSPAAPEAPTGSDTEPDAASASAPAEEVAAEGFRVETGPVIDSVAAAEGFPDAAAALLLSPVGRDVESLRDMVEVSGTLTCHGCGRDLPFQVSVMPMKGMGEGTDQRCHECGSVVSVSQYWDDDRGGWVLIARP